MEKVRYFCLVFNHIVVIKMVCDVIYTILWFQVEEKGLTIETAEKIGTFVKERGPPLELLSKIKQEGSEFLGNDASVAALKDLEILFKALEKSKCINKVVFDLSLARGLDYYTGMIFEAVFKGTTQVNELL